MQTATFYEANAGTGKTTRLTTFILEAVEKGMALERICALTFTQKAANEMLDRLRSRVAELIQEGKLDPQQMQRAGRCFIGTIHAFCLQLLKRYSSDLPVPPVFDVDPAEERFLYLFENRWDEFLSKLLLSESDSDQAVIKMLGVTTLRSLAEMLVKTRHELQRPEQSDDLGWLVRNLTDQKRWQHKKGTWRGFASQLIGNYQANRSVLTAMVQASNLRPPFSTAVRDLLACKTDELYDAVSLLLSGFVGPFLHEYHSSGYVRYDDLLLFARRLLSKKAIRSELKNRYDLLLVDEMQDTDAVQYEIVLCMCESKTSHETFSLRQLFAGEKRVTLQEGKLFVVGDPKQSIYGFRNADLSAYESMKQILLNAGASIIPLTENYRSCPNLVDFSNSLASLLFPQMQPKDSVPGRPELCEDLDASQCIQLVRIISPDSDRSHLRILSEANWIASKIRTLVDAGEASYKDFGVLLRKLVHSHLYVDAFAAHNIDVIVEGERFFYRSQEVIDFINLLKFIVDPLDDLALAGTLRSPLFAFDDRTLASFFVAYRKNGRQIREAVQATVKPELGADRLVLIDRIFEIRQQLPALSPAQLVDQVIDRLPVLAVAGLAYGSYRSTIAPLNLQRIEKLAVEMEMDPAFNVFHFVSMLSEYSREGKERSQEPLSDEGLNAVRMMSIHNSKGLDFPMVFVPLTDYETRQSFTGDQVIHEWAGNITGLKINGITETNYLRLKYGRIEPVLFSGDEPVEMEQEEKRVLYVAATRAKRRLYFCCLQKATGKSILELLQTVNPFLPIKEEPSSADVPEPPIVPSRNYEAFQPVTARWGRLEQIAKTPANRLLSTITREAEKDKSQQEDWMRFATDARRSTGVLVGLLCHAVLEKYEFGKQRQPVESLLQKEKAKYLHTVARAQMELAMAESLQILRRFLDSEAGEWLRSVQIVGREIPIIHTTDSRILTGQIDLLAKENGNLWIVDYKSDASVTDAGLSRYAGQLNLYASALKATLSAPLKARLIFIRTGEMVDVPLIG